jgi:hypothetical protein
VYCTYLGLSSASWQLVENKYKHNWVHLFAEEKSQSDFGRWKEELQQFKKK